MWKVEAKTKVFLGVSILVIPSKFIILHWCFSSKVINERKTMTTVYTGDKLKNK